MFEWSQSRGTVQHVDRRLEGMAKGDNAQEGNDE